jgi:hypothetical protein
MDRSEFVSKLQRLNQDQRDYIDYLISDALSGGCTIEEAGAAGITHFRSWLSAR